MNEQAMNFVVIPREAWQRMQDTLTEISEAISNIKHPDSWLNTEEACNLLKISSPITLARYREKYHIKTSRMGRNVLYSSNDIKRILIKKSN